MVKPGREDIKQYRDGALAPDLTGSIPVLARTWPSALTRPEERMAPLHYPRHPSSQPSESPRVVSSPRQTSLMSTMPSSLLPPTPGMYRAPDESINSAAAATPVSEDRVIGSRLTSSLIRTSFGSLPSATACATSPSVMTVRGTRSVGSLITTSALSPAFLNR